MKHGNGLLPTLVSDTSYARVFSEVLVDVRRVSANAKAMSESVKNVTNKMNDHDNAVGVLLADTAFAHKLQNTIKNTEMASQKLDENMEALKHNFLLRGYFRKQDKKEKKEKEKEAAVAGEKQ